MKAKLITLTIGVPLVALGSRWVENFSPATALSAAIAVIFFVVGQTVVRFEDYGGAPRISRLERWLNNR